ncbi:MAG: hypothetical protein KDD63_17100 [Bacteroidetes bacterium]|nr:hypothetical protein [Bacteroidota bacterium]MCB0853948.1 hypothetical protein [Bacteroidota bacterium]
MILIALGICIGLVLPVIFWYNRNDSWASIKKRTIITLPLMAIGIIIFFLPQISGNESLGNELRIFAMGLIYPQIISMVELICSQISIQVNGRDFYLWLSRSQDIENEMIQFTWLDKVLSMFLIIGKAMFIFALIHWVNNDILLS